MLDGDKEVGEENREYWGKRGFVMLSNMDKK